MNNFRTINDTTNQEIIKRKRSLEGMVVYLKILKNNYRAKIILIFINEQSSKFL